MRIPVPIALAGLLTACEPTSDPQAIRDSVRANESPGRIAAKVGDRVIALSDLDAAIRLPLYDLERAQYDLRAQQLTRLVDAAGPGAREIFLQPPLPPRLDIGAGSIPLQGAKDAPIALKIFCSFQSPHCARIQPTLQALTQQYGPLLAWYGFDYPQQFHRQGRLAALAARCAGAQGHYWDYAQGLYAFHLELDLPRYQALARQLQLDLETFTQCFEQQRFRSEIEADLAYGEQLGLGNVPVVFINGLYLPGPQPLEEYQRWIQWEVQRLGLPVTATPTAKGANPMNKGEVSVRRTQLPLKLVATSLSSAQEQSTALIQVDAAPEPQRFQVWQTLLPRVVLVAVEEHQVLLDNQGQLEFLPLIAGDPGRVAATATGQATMATTSASQGPGSAANEEERRVLPPSGQIPLKRAWVDAQLESREALEKRFQSAEHVVEGHHLLKLQDIQQTEFYQALGLQEGDVLLRVNDQWLHEGQNPLWQALESQAQVSVVLIRNGLPVHNQYRIE